MVMPWYDGWRYDMVMLWYGWRYDMVMPLPWYGWRYGMMMPWYG